MLCEVLQWYFWSSMHGIIILGGRKTFNCSKQNLWHVLNIEHPAYPWSRLQGTPSYLQWVTLSLPSEVYPHRAFLNPSQLTQRASFWRDLASISIKLLRFLLGNMQSFLNRCSSNFILQLLLTLSPYTLATMWPDVLFRVHGRFCFHCHKRRSYTLFLPLLQ